jgi:HAD superfamily hydrolase (TIGR01549 family)
MARFDGLIFDLGNTLIYFDGHWPEVSAQADLMMLRHLRNAGLALDEQTFLENYRRQVDAYYQERESEFIEYTMSYVLRKILADWGYNHLPENLLRQALDATYAVSQAYWRPEADALPTLQALRRQGYRLGLISNAADDRDVQKLVDKAQIRPFFDRILTSAAEGVRKPNPRIFQTMLDFWGLPAQRVAMVGDTLGADILGARNAGIFSIWITRRADSPANRAHAGTIVPDAKISTLSELPLLLENL